MPYYLHRIEYVERETHTTYELPDFDDAELANQIQRIKDGDLKNVKVVRDEIIFDDSELTFYGDDQRADIVKLKQKVMELEQDIERRKFNP